MQKKYQDLPDELRTTYREISLEPRNEPGSVEISHAIVNLASTRGEIKLEEEHD